MSTNSQWTSPFRKFFRAAFCFGRLPTNNEFALRPINSEGSIQISDCQARAPLALIEEFEDDDLLVDESIQNQNLQHCSTIYATICKRNNSEQQHTVREHNFSRNFRNRSEGWNTKTIVKYSTEQKNARTDRFIVNFFDKPLTEERHQDVVEKLKIFMKDNVPGLQGDLIEENTIDVVEDSGVLDKLQFEGIPPRSQILGIDKKYETEDIASENNVSNGSISFSDEDSNNCSLIGLNLRTESSYLEARTTHNIYENVNWSGKLYYSMEELESEINNNSCEEIKLENELHLQSKIMQQASAAVEVSRSRPDTNLESFVEAEKILLVSTMKYKCIKQQMECNSKQAGMTALLEIHNIRIPLRKEREECGWLLCVITIENVVKCSEAKKIYLSETSADFNETFKFEGITSNYRGKFELYFLSKDEKILNQRHSLLRRSIRRFTSKESDNVSNIIHSSAFLHSGTVNLDLYTATNAILLYRFSNTHNSPNANTMTFQVDIKNHNMPKYSGFLTVGYLKNDLFVWNRLWCCLDSGILKFWPYPNEVDCKKPIDIIEIADCTRRIDDAMKNDCPRPRSLVVVTSKSAKILRRYLIADNIDQMKEWKRLLNVTYDGISDWNLLNSRKGVLV